MSITNLKNVLVVMNDNDAIKEYADIAYEITQKHCFNKEYDVERYHNVYYPEIHIAWQKIPLLIDMMQKKQTTHGYIVWIDSDAFFNKDTTFSLDDFLPTGSKWVTLSEDIQRYECGEYGLSINTGVMIFRICNESIQFLWDLLNRYKHEGWPFFEQGGIIQMIQNQLITLRDINFVPYNTLQTFPHAVDQVKYMFNPGALVYHFPGSSKEERIKRFTDIYEQLK